jgi:hypothetical protein
MKIFLMTWADSLRSKASAEPYTTSSKTKENELTHRLLERDQVRRPHTGRDCASVGSPEWRPGLRRPTAPCSVLVEDDCDKICDGGWKERPYAWNPVG